MPHRMAHAARLWKNADKAKFQELAETIKRPTIDTLDPVGQKTYIRDQLLQIHSCVCMHVSSCMNYNLIYKYSRLFDCSNKSLVYSVKIIIIDIILLIWIFV